MGNNKNGLKKPGIGPPYISTEEVERALHFLNTAGSPEVISEAIVFPGRRDIGQIIAKNILDTRKELGEFKNAEQLLGIPHIGPQRLAEIIKAFGRVEPVGEYGSEADRANFRRLILQNPNYFGNLTPSPFKPVKPMANNTTYEQLQCIGFNPQFERLEAVVDIKQETGYGGGICSSGSREYIRFYLDLNNDGTWSDAGLVSFTAYNIPGDKPVQYGAVLDIDIPGKWCGVENLPGVRGILSWNYPPPANTPGFIPVWGNVLEARIQAEPLKFIPIGEIISQAKIPQAMKKAIDFNQEIALVEPQALGAAELAGLYKNTAVPAHRFGFTAVKKILARPDATPESMPAEFASLKAALPDVKIEALWKALLNTDGNTSYEELNCVGFDNRSSVLAATLTIKLSGGYSGSLCQKGSYEHVAFWEWDQIEQTWLYLGNAAVNVHDIKSIPREGLKYAVFLPVDFSQHVKPCLQGASLVKIRAILSWETAPPDNNPNWVPAWGNREEALIHVKPGPAAAETIHTPYIETVASMGVDDIALATGLADGVSAGTASFVAEDSPFGGEIRITGRILHPPDSFTGGAHEILYKVSVRRAGVGETWQPLSNSFNLKLATLTGGMYTGPFNHLQQVTDGMWYPYLEDYSGPDKRFLPIPLLAVWQTGGEMKGLWEIRIDAHDPNTGTDWPGSQVIRVCLDQKAPKTAITITGFVRPGNPVQPAQPCGKFRVGDVIHGEYSVSDEDSHFGLLTLGVLPGGSGWPSHGATPDPASRSYPVVAGAGETASWTLDTAGMAPCGYVIHLWAEDRTIVNGGTIGWESGGNAGFCLELPPV